MATVERPNPRRIAQLRAKLAANASVNRFTEGLLSRTRPTWREFLGMFVLLSGVAAAVYGTHVARGGLYSDDWAFAATADRTDGIFSMYDELRPSVGFRPLGLLSLALRFTLLGGHTKWHIVAAIGSAVLLCAVIYLLLRMLRMERVHAAAIAVLFLVVPYADATRLWATGSGANIAMIFWLLGVAVALRGLDADNRRRSVALHGGAVALYLASLLQYEVAYPAICLSGLLYLTRAGWRRALPRSVVDIVVASATVAFIVTNGSVHRAISYVDHARLMLDGGLTIFAQVALPYGTPRTAVVLGLLAVVAVVGVIFARLLGRDVPERRELVRWGTVVAGGLLLAVAGYVMYVGAIEYYAPLTPGLANRVNAIPTIGFIAAVYGLVIVAGLLVFRGRPSRRLLVPAGAIAAAIFLFVGFDRRERDSIGVWDRAYASEQNVLRTVKAQLPGLPAGSTVLTFGHPVVSENAGLPIFSSFWELRGAVRLLYGDPTIAAYPAVPKSRLTCRRRSGYLVGAGYPPSFGDRYGELYLVDVPSARAIKVTSRRDCLAAALVFKPGPRQAPLG